jgi:hypothetical protein
MNKQQFYKIYIPALREALEHDDKNYSFCVYSPDFYIASEIGLEMENYIEDELADDKFIELVDYYFDAKSHYANEINGVGLDLIKKKIIQGMEKLSLIYK